MSDEKKITLPKLGESIVSATVVQWFKKPGDQVELDEPLLEVSTDKVNSEIPSPFAGVLKEILAQPSEELQVGEALAILAAKGTIIHPPESAKSEMGDFLSPSVMRLLNEKGIPISEIGKIPRSGDGGRLTKKDVDNYQVATGSCPARLKQSDTERVPMSSLRKAIADNMIRSFYEAPHASVVTEVDVTDLMKLIGEQKESFAKVHGAKLTITSFVARAISRSMQQFPLINCSLDGETIVIKRFVNLGIAVSVDQGVMVPVIRGCQQLGLVEISQQIAELAEKTRSHKLLPVDVSEGSITMTNFGMTGAMIGIPIIRYPEVAIIGVGAITRKVAAMPDNSIAIRSVMMVSLTFDHRVLDGLYGCGFLGEVKKRLEEDLTLD